MAETIQELEHSDWGDTDHESRLIRAVHRLRRKPIDTFTIEDLRLMIGQSVGVEWLMPRALGSLEADPFAQGEMYPGDLLSNVLRVPPMYWETHPDEAARIAGIVETLRTAVHQQRQVRVEEAQRLYGATTDGHDPAQDELLELAEHWPLARQASKRPDMIARESAQPPTEALGTMRSGTGIVKWFRDAKGYGAIACSEVAPWDVWCHFSAIEGAGFRTLTPDECVEVEYFRANQDSFMYVARRVRRLSEVTSIETAG